MRSEFQISERSVTETSAPCAPGGVNLFLAFGEHFAGAEDGAIVLHDALHVEAKRRGRSLALGVAEPVEAGEREVGAVLGELGLFVARLQHLGGAQARGAAEDDEVDQRIGAEPVRAMHRHARRFAERHQSRHDRVGIAVDLGQNLAVIVGRDAAHIVVDGRQDRDRLLGQIDAGEDARALGNAGQPLMQHLGIEMVEVQVDVVLVLADAAALANLHRHRPADDVARGEVLGVTARSAP